MGVVGHTSQPRSRGRRHQLPAGFRDSYLSRAPLPSISSSGTSPSCAHRLSDASDPHGAAEVRLRTLERQQLSSNQTKELKNQPGWSTLAARGLDRIQEYEPASGGRWWSVMLGLPYLFEPGDGHHIVFQLDHTHEQRVGPVTKKDAQAYACRQILAVAYILDPHGVRIKYETAFKPASGGQFFVGDVQFNGAFEVLQFFSGLANERDLFACDRVSGMARGLTLEELMQRRVRATTFACSNAKMGESSVR